MITLRFRNTRLKKKWMQRQKGYLGRLKNMHTKAVGGTSLGDPVVKNPPADAGDTGSVSGWGRPHMPWGD